MFRKIFITMLLAVFCTSAFSQPGRKAHLRADITQLSREALLSGAITQNQADSIAQQEAQERIHTLVADSKKSFYSYSSLDTWQLIAIYILRIFMGGTSGADPSLRYAPIRNGRTVFPEPDGLREFDESVFLESAFDAMVYRPSEPIPLYAPSEYGNGASR